MTTLGLDVHVYLHVDSPQLGALLTIGEQLMAHFSALQLQLTGVTSAVGTIETGVQQLLSQDAQDQLQIDSVASALGEVRLRLDAVVTSLTPVSGLSA